MVMSQKMRWPLEGANGQEFRVRETMETSFQNCKELSFTKNLNGQGRNSPLDPSEGTITLIFSPNRTYTVLLTYRTVRL